MQNVEYSKLMCIYQHKKRERRKQNKKCQISLESFVSHSAEQYKREELQEVRLEFANKFPSWDL